MNPIDYFSRTNEYFLWITSTKGAGGAERPRINNGDFPTDLAALLGDDRCCIASPDYDEIELLSHDDDSCAEALQQAKASGTDVGNSGGYAADFASPPSE